jgi:hypothetical protein
VTMLLVSEAIEKVSSRKISFGLATLRPALMESDVLR